MANCAVMPSKVPDSVNQELARRAAERLSFQYMLAAEASTILRANKAKYDMYCNKYQNLVDIQRDDIVELIIKDLFGWTNLDGEDVAFLKVAFDELFQVDVNNSAEYNSDDVEYMVIEQDFKCGICGEDLSFEDAEAEHLFAKCFFGSRLGPQNLRAAHKKCNCMKSVMLFVATYRPQRNYIEHFANRFRRITYK